MGSSRASFTLLDAHTEGSRWDDAVFFWTAPAPTGSRRYTIVSFWYLLYHADATIWPVSLRTFLMVELTYHLQSVRQAEYADTRELQSRPKPSREAS